MADSSALRSRRSRAHAANDHHLCRSRCDARTALRIAPSAPGEAEPCSDPAAEMRLLAGRLVAAHEADPANALLARELRATLLALGGPRAGKMDPELAEFLAGFHEA